MFTIKERIDPIYGDHFYFIFKPHSKFLLNTYLHKNGMWQNHLGTTLITTKDRIGMATGIYKTREEAEEVLTEWVRTHPEEFAKFIAEAVLHE